MAENFVLGQRDASKDNCGPNQHPNDDDDCVADDGFFLATTDGKKVAQNFKSAISYVVRVMMPIPVGRPRRDILFQAQPQQQDY